MTGWREEFAELLRRAGLETVGDWPAEEDDVLPPVAVWRLVAAYGAEPAVAVQEDRPDLVAELNAQWHGLAVQHGVIGEDGVFLVHVAGKRGAPSWTRVRLAQAWDLAGVLGERPGRPEFVTVAADGHALLGATSEEYEIWLVAVDRLKERQEEAAQTAARESAEEREAAWASLFNGPAPAKPLHDAWIEGLGRNPAAPDDVLLRLLPLSKYPFLWRKLPTAVVDACVAHPEWRVRGGMAEAQPDLTAGQWTRLLLDEPDPKRRHLLTMCAADRRAELTDEAYERLAADPSAKVREEAAGLSGLPEQLLSALSTDPHPRVRTRACTAAWPHLDVSVRQRLLADPDSRVRAVALLRHHEDHPMPRSVFDLPGVGHQAVERCRLDRELAEELSVHTDPARRRALAGNPHLAPDLVAVLAEDADDDVRLQVSVRPGLIEEQRASVRVDIDPRLGRGLLPWVAALHDDPDAMRRCAASSHLLVRSSVARARHLPPDVVALLAGDEDRVVRLFLAESCDDAPGDMLLEVWRWWSGSLSHPNRPYGHPNFPRTDLLRYADDPHPRMRQLALDDPASTAELVERFSRDPDAEVRRRAATDPRLSAAAAVRLLDDGHRQVRRAAAAHPRLPARVLVRLLRDTDTADDAATNPGLPVTVMHRMIDQRARTGD